MIHYHGCRLSGDKLTTIRALQGKHAFVSYADSADIEIIAECVQSFAIDNGAFSAWKSGTTFDLNGYADFIEDWSRHPALDWYVIPDVIDGSEKDNILMRSAWREICPKDAISLGVPVWHMHESLSELKYLSIAYPRVAIGSSGAYARVGDALWWSRIAEAMDVICDDNGRPACKLHGMRMLDPSIFSHLPFSSCDSTNVARNIGIDSAWKGTYTPKTKEARAMIMMERIESHASASSWCGKSAGIQRNYELFG